MNVDSFFEWVSLCSIDDADRALAYDDISLEAKAAIKETIANQYTLFGTLPAKYLDEHCYSTCTLREFTRPLSYAVFFIPEEYAFPQCATSALLASIQAGVSNVVPILMHGWAGISEQENTQYQSGIYSLPEKKATGALLAACDFLGIEHVCRLLPQNCHDALQQLQKLKSVKILILGESIECDTFYLQSLSKGFIAQRLSVQKSLDPQAHQQLSLIQGSELHRSWIWPEALPESFLQRTFSLETQDCSSFIE